MLDIYRRDDGSMWGGGSLERATNGQVPARYVSQLKRGIIKDPSFSKILAISRAMGIPLESWTSDRGELDGERES